MKREATVPTVDLEAAINYLEGLEVILRRFHVERRGVEDGDELVRELERLEDAVYEWAPLRYQLEGGQGWSFVAESLAELRHRLVERYGDAAL